MSNAIDTQITPTTASRLLSLSTRVTVASFVYIVDGVTASLLLMLANADVLFIAGALLLWASCGAAFLFRHSKLGTDVFDLYFFDAMVATGLAVCYEMGGDPAPGWYITAGLLFLRLTRVFAWAGTVTHDSGWGVFGIMSYLESKKSAPSRNQMAMLKALGLAILGAAIASVLAKQLSETTRVALVWSCGLLFLISAGPNLLRTVAGFIANAMSSNQHATEDAEEIARLTQALADKEAQQRAVDAEKEAMRKTIDALREQHNLPNEEVATLIASYMAIHEVKRAHLVEMAVTMAELYPAPPKTTT